MSATDDRIAELERMIVALRADLDAQPTYRARPVDSDGGGISGWCVVRGYVPEGGETDKVLAVTLANRHSDDDWYLETNTAVSRGLEPTRTAVEYYQLFWLGADLTDEDFPYRVRSDEDTGLMHPLPIFGSGESGIIFLHPMFELVAPVADGLPVTDAILTPGGRANVALG